MSTATAAPATANDDLGGTAQSDEGTPHGWRHIPLCVLGIGIYRAWIEIMFVGSFVEFPTAAYASHDVFDLFMITTLLVCSALARHISPLYRRRWATIGGTAALVASSALAFLSFVWPGAALALAWAGTFFGGAGIALTILLWSELYGSFSPVRISLYYSLSLLIGGIVILVYRGFKDPWLPAMTCLLPLISIWMFSTARRLPFVEKRIDREWVPFSFPLKPVLVIATYSFAFGLQEAQTYRFGGPHSAPGMMLAAFVVAGSIMLLRDRVDFARTYGQFLPFASAVFLAFPIMGAGFLDPWVAAQLSHIGYTATEIFIMVMIGSICYLYGASALWLFGIERAVRAIALMLGRYTFALTPPGSEGILTALVVLAVLVATFVILTEKRLATDWGVQMLPESTEQPPLTETARRNALATRCSELARTHKLSQREEEVLLLLADRMSIAQIERELYIANGTAKAHVRHIYAKLDIHSRDELFELCGDNRSRDDRRDDRPQPLTHS